MENVIITVARHYGSGGKTVGKLLAEQMGIPCYDREILRMASDVSGINEQLFAKADQEMKTNPLFRITKKVYKGELLPPDSDDFVSTDNLFNYQAKVIKDLANEGSCVIIGRCADFILKDHPNIVRVFVHADHDFCVERTMEYKSIDAKEAEKFIEKRDRYRSDYYKYHTGHEWNDARNYDLCLDSGKLGFDKMIEVIKGYMKVRFE